MAPSSMASGFALPDSMEEAAERFGWIDLVFRQFLRVLCSPLDLLVVYPLSFCLFSDRPLVQFSLSSSPARPSGRNPGKAAPPPRPSSRRHRDAVRTWRISAPSGVGGGIAPFLGWNIPPGVEATRPPAPRRRDSLGSECPGPARWRRDRPASSRHPLGGGGRVPDRSAPPPRPGLDVARLPQPPPHHGDGEGAAETFPGSFPELRLRETRPVLE